MIFVLDYSDLVAHSRPYSLLKRIKVYVAFLLWIKHFVHQSHNFLLGSLDLVLLQMGFEVLVRNEAVTISVHFPEHLEKSRLTVKNFVFQLH